MSRRIRNLVVVSFLSAAFLPGCAAMMEQWRAENCNYEGAYRTGMNDSRKGEEMRAGFAGPCPAQSKAAAERGYREGYTAGTGAAPVVVGGAPAGAPPPAGWRCLEAYGKKACGFQCVQAYGEVVCSQQPEHNCVQSYGKIRCGLNCRAEHGDIQCDG